MDSQYVQAQKTYPCLVITEAKNPRIHSLKAPVLNKATGAMKLYDLSGRRIDKMTGRKTGVYIATYGRQGALIKKLVIRD
jgi:hypothetical protein